MKKETKIIFLISTSSLLVVFIFIFVVAANSFSRSMRYYAKDRATYYKNKELNIVKKNTVISCNSVESNKQCIEYNGPGWTIEGAAKSCACPVSEIRQEPCPTENLIGKCFVSKGMGDIYYTIFDYVGFKLDVKEVEEICINGGNKFILPNE